MIRALRISAVFESLKSRMLSRTSNKSRAANLARRARGEGDIIYPIQASASGSGPIKCLQACTSLAIGLWRELDGIEENVHDYVSRWKLASRAGACIFELNYNEETHFPHRLYSVDDNAMADTCAEAAFCRQRLDDVTQQHLKSYPTEKLLQSSRARATREGNAVLILDHSQKIERSHAQTKRASRASSETHQSNVLRCSAVRAIHLARNSDKWETQVQTAIQSDRASECMLSENAPDSTETAECMPEKQTLGKGRKRKLHARTAWFRGNPEGRTGLITKKDHDACSLALAVPEVRAHWQRIADQMARAPSTGKVRRRTCLEIALREQKNKY
jgi:hypothetical protein